MRQPCCTHVPTMLYACATYERRCRLGWLPPQAATARAARGLCQGCMPRVAALNCTPRLLHPAHTAAL